MKVKTVRHTVLALALSGSAILAGSGQIGDTLPGARADASCQAMLQSYVAWINQDTSRHYVGVQAASQNADQPNQFVSYAKGNLFPFYTLFGPRIIVAFTGTATQYFSDRHTTLPTGGFGTDQPFSALNTDSLGIEVDTTGATTFTLKSWGGGQVSLSNPQCANGVLYGFTNTSPAALFALSFSLRTQP